MWYREMVELMYWEKSQQIDEKQMLVAAVTAFCKEILEDSLLHLFSRPGLSHAHMRTYTHTHTHTHTHTLVII